jgi:hypothetical protein
LQIYCTGYGRQRDHINRGAKGNVIKKIDGEGDVPEKIEYPLDEGLDFRKMTFSIEALDEVGNSFKMTKAIPSLFTGKTPFAGLKNKGKINFDF